MTDHIPFSAVHRTPTSRLQLRWPVELSVHPSFHRPQPPLLSPSQHFHHLSFLFCFLEFSLCTLFGAHAHMVPSTTKYSHPPHMCTTPTGATQIDSAPSDQLDQQISLSSNFRAILPLWSTWFLYKDSWFLISVYLNLLYCDVRNLSINIFLLSFAKF